MTDPLPFLNTFGISEACLLLIAGSLPALGPLLRRARARLASYSGSGWSVTEIGGRYLRSKRSHSTSRDGEEKRKESSSGMPPPPLAFHGYDIDTAAAARRKASEGSARTLTLDDDDIESRAGLRDDGGSRGSSPSTTNMTRLSPPPLALAPLHQHDLRPGSRTEEETCGSEK